MAFKKVLKKRKTIRSFSKRPVNIDEIKDAIYDAFLAPTYNHSKEWYFILVNDLESKIRLTETENLKEQITEEIKSSFQDYDPSVREMYLDAIPKQKKMIIESATAIVIVYKPKTKVSEAKKIYDLNGLASVWCAIENLLLSLAEKDVFGVTFIPKNTSGVKKVLGIPEEYEVATIIPVGYKKEAIKELKPKEIEIENHIKFNTW